MENQPLTQPSKKPDLKPFLIALVCILVLAGCGSAFAFVILPHIQEEEDNTRTKDKKNSKDSDELTDKEKLLAGFQLLGEDFASDFGAIDQYLGISQLHEEAEKKPAKNTLSVDIQSIEDVDYQANLTVDTQTDAANQIFAIALSGKYSDVYEGALGQIYLSPEKISFASPLFSKDKVFSLKLENLKDQLAASDFSKNFDEEFYESLDFLEKYINNLSMEFDEKQLKKFIDEFSTSYEEDLTALHEAITVQAEGETYTVTIPQKESLRVLGDLLNYIVNHESTTAYMKDILKFAYDSEEDIHNQYPTFDEFYDGTYGTLQKSINMITGSIGNYWKNDIMFTVDMDKEGNIKEISYKKELTLEDKTLNLDLTTTFEETDSLKTIDSTWKGIADGEEISMHFTLTQTPLSSDVLTSTVKIELADATANLPIVLNADCSLDKNTKAIHMHLFVNGTNPTDSLFSLTCDGGSFDNLDEGKSLSLSLPLHISYKGKQVADFTVKNTTEISGNTPASLPGNEVDLLTITQEEWNALEQEFETNLNSMLPADLLK